MIGGKNPVKKPQDSGDGKKAKGGKGGKDG